MIITRHRNKRQARASATALFGSLCLSGICWGGVVYDSSLGAAGPASGTTNFQILQSRGKTVGSNLFYSFSSFDLTSAQTATFPNAASITNIIGRVTSGAASNINGRIASAGSANLFLMNPSGWIFGPNAKLQINGALTVTTADNIQLSDGALFNAIPGGADALLTSAVPAGYGFLSASPAGVSVSASSATGFVTPTGKSLSIVAGDITFNNAVVKAPGGRVSLISVASPGKVTLGAGSADPDAVLSGFTAMGNIGMTSSRVDSSGSGAGRVVIRGGQLVMLSSSVLSDTSGSDAGQGVSLAITGLLQMSGGSQISSQGFGSGPAGDVSIEAGQMQISDGSVVTTTSNGTGAGGSMKIHASDVLIDGANNPLSTGLLADTLGGGPGGNISLTVDKTLTVQNGGLISATTFGAASGGTIDVAAGSLAVDGMGAAGATGIFAQTAGAGAAGTVTLNISGSLSLLNGASISSSTSGAGAGGHVDVHATDISIDGKNNPLFTGISAQTSQAVGGGPGGDVTVEAAGRLTISGGGRISTSTLGSGAGGDVTVKAAQVTIDGTTATLVTGITAQSLATSGGGAGGDVSVTTPGTLTILGLGVIASDTFGTGNGGSVAVHAGDLLIDRKGNALDFTGITALSRLVPGSGKGGNAGNIHVLVDRTLTLYAGGLIDSSTFGTGNAGNVTVQAGAITADRAGSIFFDGIGSDTEGKPGGRGGDVDVIADSITLLRGGLISTGTFGDGQAGDVTVTANTIVASGQGVESAFVVSPYSGIVAGSTQATKGSPIATGNAGSVQIVSNSLSLSANAQIGSFSRGSTGGAGQVKLMITGSLSLGSGSELTAALDGMDKAKGTAPGITIYAGSISLTGASSITVSTSVNADAGTIVINTGPLTLTGGGTIASLTSGRGNAGSIYIMATSANLASGGSISAATSSSGVGGDVQINANTITISGGGANGATGVTATTESRTGGGPGGQIRITADVLNMTGSGATVSTESSGSGSSGQIALHLGTLQLQNGSSIASASQGSGNSGSVLIRAKDSVTLTGNSAISTSALQSNAGVIEIEAGSQVELIGSHITAQAALNGGNVTINTPGKVILRNSQLNAQAGGDGGNISIDPSLIVLDHSQINASAIFGDGGNILIDIPADGVLGDAHSFFVVSDFFEQTAGSLITASSEFGVQGNLFVAAPFLDLAGSLTPLPSSFLAAKSQLLDRCVIRMRDNFSSFIIVGRGGLPPAPTDFLPSF